MTDHLPPSESPKDILTVLFVLSQGNLWTLLRAIAVVTCTGLGVTQIQSRVKRRLKGKTSILHVANYSVNNSFSSFRVIIYFLSLNAEPFEHFPRKNKFLEYFRFSHFLWRLSREKSKRNRGTLTFTVVDVAANKHRQTINMSVISSGKI